MSPEANSRLSLWDAVDSMLARATPSGMEAHKLGPLAAHRLRRLGEPLPENLLREERAAAMSMLLAGPLLERVRSSCEGPLVLIKGPEVARLYPARARRFSDLDLLSQDAARVQRALVDRGLIEGSDPDLTPAWHHLQSLKSNVGLEIEVHKAPRWPVGLRPPMQEIFEAAVPAALGVEGISAPTPTHHALLLATHAWDHEPLWTLRDLIDIAAMSAQADERELNRLAEAWGLDRLWRATQRAIEAVFFGGRNTFPLRVWARHLQPVRDRYGYENKLLLLLHAYSAMPPRQASVHSVRKLSEIIAPRPGESWSQKLLRVPQALRNWGAHMGAQRKIDDQRESRE
jgi:hypothetical protein